MKRKTLTIGVLLLLGISVALAQTPGPYPVIFLHGQKKEGDPEYGYITWNRGYSWSAMEEILDEGYAGYQEGVTGRDCDENTPIPSTGGDPLRIYNFSYYNTDASMGVIGDNYDTLYPKETDYNTRVDYQNSADNACWGEQLADFIDDVLTATGASKVNIVCHSMGGLVARAAVTYYGCEDKIHKTLMIGTPNHGLPWWTELSFLANHPTWQKHGEILEMGTHSRVFATADFYTQYPEWPGWYGRWHAWLGLYDLGGTSEPLYGTIAGTKPSGSSARHEGNDGTVDAKSVKLGNAVFNRVFPKYHSMKKKCLGLGDWRDQEDCLVTCEEIEDIVKHWILDYHRPPEIAYVDWIKVGCGGVMGIIVINYWKPHVYFQFTKTPSWSFNWYHGYCYDPHIEMVGMNPQWVLWRLSFSTSNYYKRDFIDNKIPFYMNGEQGFWYVHAKQTYQGYDTTLSTGVYTANAPTEVLLPEPGCPMLFSFMDTDSSTQAALFVENNTLLPHSEHETDTATDNMVLSSPPPAYEGHYFLNISENSTETSYFDEIKLFAVDHPEGTQVATSEDGNTYVYSNVLLANYCITYTSEMVELEDDSTDEPTGEFVEYIYPLDHLDYVQHLDHYIWVGEDADSLFVSFPPIPDDWYNVGLLVSVGPGRGILPYEESLLMGMGPGEGSMIDPDKEQLHNVYSGDGGGGWIPRGKAYCRLNTSDWLIDVTSCITPDEGNTFKIVPSADSLAYIDRVALVKLETSGWSMTEAPLDSALCWKIELGLPDETVITSQLFTTDGVFAPPLEPELQYAFSFTALREDTNQVRDFVLKTHGVYISGWNPGSQLKEHGLLPREYDLRVDQLMSASRPARIFYQVAKAGRVGIQVIDVTGRQVTGLVDEYLEAGSYTLDWNGRDARGQRLASGVYFIRMVSGEFAKNVKLVILR